MKKISEKEIERKFCVFAQSYKWQSLKVYGSNGMPDRFFYRGRACFFVEFKSCRGRLSPVQKLAIKELRAEKCAVHVVSSLDEDAWMRILLDKMRDI